MENYASWIASAATMIAAMMTAANLGTRVTGWGFVVFTIGSIAWTVVGFSTGQTSLMITNGFLFAVNVFGVWRWLGRQATYEQGSAVAAERSRAQKHVPTLFSGGNLIGAAVKDRDGGVVGTVVDSMLACDTNQLAYIVIAQGGVAGAGEVLRALAPAHFNVSKDEVKSDLTSAQIESLTTMDNSAWPTQAPEPIATDTDHLGNHDADVPNRFSGRAK